MPSPRVQGAPTPVSVAMVEFYDDQIRSWQGEDGKVYVGLRDPCRTLGIDPDGQSRRLQRDECFQPYIRYRHMAITLPHSGIRYDDMLGLHLEYLPMWWASIEINRLNGTTRLKMLRYKEECTKVLRAYWFRREMVGQLAE